MKTRAFSIIVVFVALAILGCALIPRLAVKLMPSRTLPSLTVSFSMPDAAARVVEAEVTGKLESMLARIGGVREIKSTSTSGGGSITIGFDSYTDMQQARFEASTLIRQAWPELPDGVSYPSISTARSSRQSARPILSYTINAPGAPAAIMQYAEENIRPVIGRIQGVNRIALSGASPMEWRLTYDSNQLRALGLTSTDIATAVAEHNASQFYGMTLTDSGTWIAVRSTNGESREFDIKGIYLTGADSVAVRLDRLVTAGYVPSRPTGHYRINGLNSIYCNIYADEDANQLELAAKIKAALADMSLPPNYALTLKSDATENIAAELDKIYLRSGLTLLILLIFIALVTLNARYMLVIIISLTLSLFVSVIFYWLADIEIQLYSLAGITISLNLIIDNIIVMGDHYRRRHDCRVFTAVLAATLTTIGALSIVFFLDDELRLNLQDFVAVVIINLTVSLAAALWLVPALIERFGPASLGKPRRYRRTRLLAKFNRCYAAYIRFGRRWRWVILMLAVLSFGIPVFMIPEYKCSDTYNKDIRPWVNRILGGTLRLFVEEVYAGSYFSRNEHEPVLQISASLPNGATLEQMDALVRKMEQFLSGFAEITQFRTDIYSARQATIAVSFTAEATRSGFPYQLKALTISEALTLGGGSWAVFGLEDRGFDNSVAENAGSYQVRIMGYNYDELEALAEQFRQKLLSHRRIKEVTVNSEFSWYKDDYTEFYLDIDSDAMARQSLNVYDLYSALTPAFGRDIYCGMTPDGAQRILLDSRQNGELDVWALMNLPFTVRGKTFKLSQFATVRQLNASRSIAKENQQYVLCLQYEYIGSQLQGQRMLDKDIEEFRGHLPLGYSIEDPHAAYRWGPSSSKNLWLLLLVIAIIFWTTAILFNSLSRPLIVIATIPLSFIGVFLIFYLTGANFDQGGFAAFVLMSGLTVNAAIYLLTEYERTDNYIRAFNAKIIPILLTIASTVLGFIPFMVGPDAPEPFWLPLALGTIGGLTASLLTLLFLLPLLLPSRSLRPYPRIHRSRCCKTPRPKVSEN